MNGMQYHYSGERSSMTVFDETGARDGQENNKGTRTAEIYATRHIRELVHAEAEARENTWLRLFLGLRWQ